MRLKNIFEHDDFFLKSMSWVAMAVFVYRGYYLPSSSLALYGHTYQPPYRPAGPQIFLF